MKRLVALVGRWRGRGAEDPPGEAAAPPPRRLGRNRALLAAAALLALTAAVVVALLYRDEPPPPAPAVPPGQLALEMEQSRSGGQAGVVTIDAETAERLGLQTAVVEPGAIEQEVRTTGRVTPDERRMTRVNMKVEGWIEQAFVNFEGQQVRRGQPLFTIYSPELVATQQEYLLALRARRDFQKSEFDVVRESGDSLVDAARRRLLLWDVTPEQIAQIERTGKAVKNLTVYAPASGVVTERKAFPGMRVTPETDLYTLADLSPIWVEADVFESDLPSIRVGTPAEVILPGGEVRGARVAYINPFVDPGSRTAQVRLELPNPDLSLKPGMFVSVTLQSAKAPQLVIPRDAVLDTGARQLALVDEGQGRFALREIRTGEQGTDYYTVLSGLAPGERVARNIQFLIDSETELRQAIERFRSGTPGGASAGSSGGSMPGVPGNSAGEGPP